MIINNTRNTYYNHTSNKFIIFTQYSECKTVSKQKKLARAI